MLLIQHECREDEATSDGNDDSLDSALESKRRLAEYTRLKKRVFGKKIEIMTGKLTGMVKKHFEMMGDRGCDNSVQSWYLDSLDKIIEEKSSHMYRALDLVNMNYILNITRELEESVSNLVREFLEKHRIYVFFTNGDAIKEESNVDYPVINNITQEIRQQDILIPTKIRESSILDNSGIQKVTDVLFKKTKGPCSVNSSIILKQWYSQNMSDPYPSIEEKQMLSNRTGLTVKQVTDWFVNKRMRNSKKGKDTICIYKAGIFKNKIKR